MPLGLRQHLQGGAVSSHFGRQRWGRPCGQARTDHPACRAGEYRRQEREAEKSRASARGPACGASVL